MDTRELPHIGLGEAPRVQIKYPHERMHWFDVALGPPANWPPGLRAILSTVLACPLPMFLGWGEELTFCPNHAALEALGPLAGDGIGKPLHSALAPIWPQVRPLADKAAGGTGCSADDVPLHLSRAGEPRESWWDLACTPVSDDDGHVVGVICLLRETTEAVVLRRAREDAATRLRAALAAGDKIGAWDWDVVNNRVRSETTFALFYCVDPELAKSGVPLEEYFRCMHPEDRLGVERQIAASIKTGETFYCEYRLIGAGGETHWISAQGKPEYDDTGKCVRFPGISFDITLNKLKAARRGNAA